jgi:hypothetical protein
MFFQNKKLFLIAFIFLTLFLSGKVYANPQITEVMYDVSGTDTNREWIEIYNPDNTALDLTKLKFFEANTNHTITASVGNGVLDPQGFAVLADKPDNFKTDFPGYTGQILDSTFSLSNSGENLALKAADGTILDSITYDPLLGAGGDGNSLQKIANSWAASAPTPGADNSVSQPVATTTPPVATTTATTSPASATTTIIQTHTVIKYLSVHSSPEDLSSYQENPVFELSAGRERVVYVGTPLEFAANHKLSKDLQWVSCTFIWSYGDGMEGIGEHVSHIYKHAGEYSVIVNGTCGSKNSVSRTKVLVLAPHISMVITATDIEIFNNGSTEVNLGLWKIKNESDSFVFPQDTIIAPLHSILLSIEDTKIKLIASSTISLYNPMDKVIAMTNYNVPVASVPSPVMDVYNQIQAQEEYIQPIVQKGIPSNVLENIPKTASVGDSVGASVSEGFWHKIWQFPANTIRHIFQSFYNFQ